MNQQWHTGQPFAFIKIPAFGQQWRFTLIQGTALAQLNESPGHVPGTQWPGQLGNFAIAGHRVTAGARERYLRTSGALMYAWLWRRLPGCTPAGRGC